MIKHPLLTPVLEALEHIANGPCPDGGTVDYVCLSERGENGWCPACLARSVVPNLKEFMGFPGYSSD